MTDRYKEIRDALEMGPTPGPWVPKELPRDIQRGNEGIDYGAWTGWDGPADFAPLPQYPQPWDLPERPPSAGNDRDRGPVRNLRTRQCRSRGAAVSMRDRLAAVACYVLVFLVLPALPFIAAAARGWRP